MLQTYVRTAAASVAIEEKAMPGARKLFSVSPDGKWVAFPGAEHSVEVWHADGSAQHATYYGHRAGVYNRRSGSICELTWLGSEQVVSKSTDGSIHRWQRSGIHIQTIVNGGEQSNLSVEEIAQSASNAQ